MLHRMKLRGTAQQRVPGHWGRRRQGHRHALGFRLQAADASHVDGHIGGSVAAAAVVARVRIWFAFTDITQGAPAVDFACRYCSETSGDK